MLLASSWWVEPQTQPIRFAFVWHSDWSRGGWGPRLAAEADGCRLTSPASDLMSEYLRRNSEAMGVLSGSHIGANTNKTACNRPLVGVCFISLGKRARSTVMDSRGLTVREAAKFVFQSSCTCLPSRPHAGEPRRQQRSGMVGSTNFIPVHGNGVPHCGFIVHVPVN